MRLEKWFVTTLDDSQKKVIAQPVDQKLIVQGVAGSGKTNLAIHRILQVKGRGSYAIAIFSVALKRMIAYGMRLMGLDSERVVYEWAWRERGFDKTGDVYMEKDSGRYLYLVNDMSIRKFVRSEKSGTTYGVDFGDYVLRYYYDFFGRRTSWFREIPYEGGFDVKNEEKFKLIPSGVMYEQCTDPVDYLAVDEGQDFSIEAFQRNICPRVKKGLYIFGDTTQRMRRTRPGMAYREGCSLSELATALGDEYICMQLKFNWRVSLSIARFAQHLMGGMVDLVVNNQRGEDGPRPEVVRCRSREAELDAIIQRINAEGLDDVAILLRTDSEVMFVNKYLNDRNVSTQTYYHTGTRVPFHTINTLDFSNTDLPCVLTYYSAKGSEFENVFIPFANAENLCKRNDFYVACTRSSRNLVISFTGVRIHHLDGMDPQLFDEYQI